ncbi:MAG: hypothetical protein JJU11_09145 [Candidatus Sumerlaeia bacterium]|nr:hypothetical protein [Candidatus Sumerlaeia bacterium]
MDKPIDNQDTWIAAIRGLGDNPVKSLSMNRKLLAVHLATMGLVGLTHLYMISVASGAQDIFIATWLSIILVCTLTFFWLWRGDFACRHVESWLLTRLTAREVIVGLSFWPMVMSFLFGGILSVYSIVALTRRIGPRADWIMGPIDLGKLAFHGMVALAAIVLVISAILHAFLAFHYKLLWKVLLATLFIVGNTIFYILIHSLTGIILFDGIPDKYTFPEQFLHILVILIFLASFLLRQFYLADKRYTSLLHGEMMAAHSSSAAEKWWKQQFRLGERKSRSTFSRGTLLRLLNVSLLSFAPLVILSLLSFLTAWAVFDHQVANYTAVDDGYNVDYTEGSIPHSTIIAVAVFSGPLNMLLPIILSAGIVIVLRLYPRAWKPIPLPDHRALSTAILLALFTLPGSLAILFHGFSVSMENAVFPGYLWGNLDFVHYALLGFITLYHLLVVIGLAGWLLSFRRSLLVSLVLLAIPVLLHAVFLLDVTIYNLDLFYGYNDRILFLCILLPMLLIIFSLPNGPDRLHRKLLRDESENGASFFIYTNKPDSKEHQQ